MHGILRNRATKGHQHEMDMARAQQCSGRVKWLQDYRAGSTFSRPADDIVCCSESRGKGAQQLAEDEVDRRYARMPASLAAALLPFQREGVRYAIARRGRCLIADEMGVGKTLQAIAFASCYQVTTNSPASGKCKKPCF
jgi:hypothetical protein